MSIKDLIVEYLDGNRDAISTIRAISGAFNPEIATNLLSLICAITRIEQGDLDKETMRKIYLK